MNKKIAILGAGESGTGAAVLAKKQGFRVWVSDSGKSSSSVDLEADVIDAAYGAHRQME